MSGNDIYYVTNREPRITDKYVSFTKKFNSDGIAALRFGKATVNGSKIDVSIAEEKMVLDKLDKDFYKVDYQKSKLGSNKILGDIADIMRNSCKDTIIFVHGYNVSFKEAIKTCNRIKNKYAHLDGGKGVNVVSFSWPSDGSNMPWIAYYNDRKDASASGNALARGMLIFAKFLSNQLAADRCNGKVHLMCHSMGCYLLRHAVQDMKNYISGYFPRIFDQIILVAADEDEDTFEHDHKLARLPELGIRTSLYFNNSDVALSLSDKTKNNPDRLGQTGARVSFQLPSRVSQIDTTHVVKKGIAEHSYFLKDKEVIDDISAVLEGKRSEEIEGRKWQAERNQYVLHNQN